MKLNIQFWLKFSLLNLCLVAALGVLMRYKIGFEFPFFNQKHFAFPFSFCFFRMDYAHLDGIDGVLHPDQNN